jgi:hypothetical protein
LLAGLVLVAGGCVGSGSGWLTGSLYVSNCVSGEPLDRQGDFDLHLDFYTGDPVVDASASTAERRNSLMLRLQNATNNIEESDGVVFEFPNLGGILQRISQGVPIAVTNKNLCTSPCPLSETDDVRATIYLHASCPDSHYALLGSNREMKPLAGDPPCQSPTQEVAACPTQVDRKALDDLCAGDFNDRNLAGTIDGLLGGGACMYVCQLGQAKPGESAPDRTTFSVDFGNRVAAIFAMNVVDGRAVAYGSCANATGKVRGMFAYNVVRGHSAQTFP